jgi:SAM-dependent methyltransferase
MAAGGEAIRASAGELRMSKFSAEWLALREPFDVRARNRDVLDAVVAAFQDRRELSIVDLGSGTGATVRALAPLLPKPQRWTLVDNDPVLLAEAFALTASEGVAVETRQFDLKDDVGPLFDGADLVTASALIDLVSEPWLANLAAAAAARALPVYIALTYDGRVAFGKRDGFEDDIIAAVNKHQRTDKGFGPALGPRAAKAAKRIFKSLGYAFLEGPSDWRTAGGDTKFQIELIEGWYMAAREMEAMSDEGMDAFYIYNCRMAEAGTQTIDVGHVDFFAQPRKR